MSKHVNNTSNNPHNVVRFLHTSDWHVGMTRHYLDAEAQARFTAARIEVIRQIGAVAREQECQFVLVAGDVFDSNLCASQTVRRALEAMRAIECPVYLLPGNHDALNAATVYRQQAFREAKPDHVHVLDAPGPYSVAPGLELLAAPLLTNTPLIDVVADAIADVSPTIGVRRILVGHGVSESLAPTADNPAAVRLAPLERALAAGVIDYVALGDRHSRCSVGSTGRIHYSGSPEVTNFRDEASGEVLVVDLEPGAPPRVTGHRVGSWQFVDLRRHVDTAADVEDLAAELAALPMKERTVVRTALSGTLTLGQKAHLDALLDSQRELLAGLFAWQRHTDLVVMVDDAELADLGIGGFVDAAVADLMACAADDSPQAEAARDALLMLYRLAAGVR